MYFGSIPSAWMGMLYERMLGLHPRLTDDDPPRVALKRDSRSRKRSGSFFTPPYMIDYIVSESLGRLTDIQSSRVMDPSMGPGDFLLRSLRFLSQKGQDPAAVAENCLYGCDIDPIAVDIARFLVWLETGGRASASEIDHHLVCADALAGKLGFQWEETFPDAFSLFSGTPGFDAVMGNPPYVASKNGSLRKKAGRGQSDYYLMFLENVLDNQLVRPGGSFSMVLPDPFLVRANATHVRRKLLRDWSVDGIVHITGAFPGAQVANIVPVCRRMPPESVSFPVVRIDKAALRRRFEVSPSLTVARLSKNVELKFALAQPRAEVLYLVNGAWEQVFGRIHGPEKCISHVKPPFMFLKDMGVETIFRGEEIGKRAITASDGELPILLGGESISRYSVGWEGRRISREKVSKPMALYDGPKIVLQKSSSKLIAAFDTEGYVVPQSVYGIRLLPDGYHPLYLLALLNSTFMNAYAFRAFTGYKLVQPQIELEDVRRLPIRKLSFTTEAEERETQEREGRRTFEREFMEWAEDFPALTKLVKGWLKTGREDAVHDLLVFLAGFAIRFRQDGNTNAVLSERIDRAIDIVVNRLYGWKDERRTDTTGILSPTDAFHAITQRK
jgi:hypothetical protein